MGPVGVKAPNSQFGLKKKVVCWKTWHCWMLQDFGCLPSLGPLLPPWEVQKPFELWPL